MVARFVRLTMVLSAEACPRNVQHAATEL